MRTLRVRKDARSLVLVCLWLFPAGAAMAALILASASLAQHDGGQVQLIQGTLGPEQFFYYRVPNLKAGDVLSVRAAGESGDLDPIVGLLPGTMDTHAMETAYQKGVEDAVAAGEDPLVAIERIRNQYFVAWDDDSGGGLTAAMHYTVTAPGDYRLLVAGTLSAMGESTFGDYAVVVGLNAPAALVGNARESGAPFVFLDTEASPRNRSVQMLTGTLNAAKYIAFRTLQPLQTGDTFYARVEATEGGLSPTLVLRNFAGKPIRVGNPLGLERSAVVSFTAPSIAKNYRLDIIACCEDNISSGDYLLWAGLNAPEVMDGPAEPEGAPPLQAPITVATGFKLLQIVNIDQQNETMSIVGAVQMEWTDPSLAFNPEECNCAFKIYNDSTFDDFLKKVNNRWPEYILYNEQGMRNVYNRDVAVSPDGQVQYYERFATDVQVDFDFMQYPFDTQNFTISLDQLLDEEFYVYSELPGFSEISGDHGEDEFILTTFDTRIETQSDPNEGSRWSRFIFHFSAPRHLDYYILQIFVPIMLITLVSWFIFFLRDYTFRIEVASANLLLFIAFSFSLSTNYPRLGYMTFMDAIMTMTFIMNAFVVLYNVVLKRMETKGNGPLTDTIDSVLDWAYPLFYIAAILALVKYFLR